MICQAILTSKYKIDKTRSLPSSLPKRFSTDSSGISVLISLWDEICIFVVYPVSIMMETVS